MYKQFVEKVIEILRGMVDGQTHLSINTITKNNGYERMGITFSKEGSNVSPTIYLEEYYEEYLHGGDIEKISGKILDIYHRVRIKHNWGEAAVQDYQNVKDRIIYKLVNQEKNRELLEQVPHVDYLDLAVLFYVLVEIDEAGERTAMMLIRNEHLAWWNVTAEEIREHAEANTEKLLPYEFSSMNMIITEMLEGVDLDDEELAEMKKSGMHVLTNYIRNGGAAAILYPGRLEAIGTYLKENYYILPSSTHEVIIISESQSLPKEEMECTVREVNETQVQEEEFLSNHIYYYDRSEKELRRA